MHDKLQSMPHFNEVNDEVGNSSVEFVKHFMRNIHYLAKSRGITQRKLISDLREIYGVRVGRTYFYYLRTGRRKSCHVIVIAAFAHYFGISIYDILLRDYSAE